MSSLIAASVTATFGLSDDDGRSVAGIVGVGCCCDCCCASDAGGGTAVALFVDGCVGVILHGCPVADDASGLGNGLAANVAHTLDLRATGGALEGLDVCGAVDVSLEGAVPG